MAHPDGRSPLAQTAHTRHKLAGVQHHFSHIPTPLQVLSRGYRHRTEASSCAAAPAPSAGPHAPPWCHSHTLPSTNLCPPLPRHSHWVRDDTVHSTSVAALPRTTPHHAPIPATPSRGVRKTAQCYRGTPRVGIQSPRVPPRGTSSPLLPPPDFNLTCPYPLR